MNSYFFIEVLNSASRDKCDPSFMGKRKILYDKLILFDENKLEVKTVFDSYVYVPFNVVVDELRISINHVLNEFEGDFYILLHTDKFSSELLLLIKVWDLVKDRVIIADIEKQDVPDDCNILLIDDFVLSGARILGFINDFKHNNPDKTIKFIVCVCGATDIGTVLMRKSGTFIKSQRIVSGRIYGDHKIPNCSNPLLLHYGRMGSRNHDKGCMLNYPPDESIKYYYWDKYFRKITKQPSIFKYVS